MSVNKRSLRTIEISDNNGYKCEDKRQIDINIGIQVRIVADKQWKKRGYKQTGAKDNCTYHTV